MALSSPTTRPPCGLRGPALRAALHELVGDGEALPSPAPESPPPPVMLRAEEVVEVWDRGPRAMGSHDLAIWLAGRSREPASGIRQRRPES
jgi:hypothetical protein